MECRRRRLIAASSLNAQNGTYPGVRAFTDTGAIARTLRSKMGNEPATEERVIETRPRTRKSGRLARNYFAQLINQLLRIGWMLLLVPLYLAVWGAETYRDWIVVVALSSFLSTCDFGLSTYFGNRFIELIARDEREMFQSELRKALCCTLGAGVGVLVVGLGYIFISHAAGALSAAAMGDGMLLGCFVLTTMLVPFYFCQGTLVTIYRAEGEFARGEYVFAAQISAMLIGSAALLTARATPLAVATWFVIVQLLTLTGMMTDLRRRYSDISFAVETPSLDELKRIVPRSLLFFASPVSMALVQSGPIMLFQIFAVPAIPVVGYTLMRTVVGLARQAAFVFAVGSGIEMARHHARAEREACGELYRITGRIVTGLAGMFGGLTLWATAPFLAVWTHHTVESDWVLILAFLGGIFLAAPGQAGLMLLTYANFPKPVAIAWCTQAGLGLVLAAGLVPIFGVDAAALSLAAAEVLLIGVCLPFVVQRSFGFSAVAHLGRCFAIGALTFGWSAFVAKLAFGLTLGGFPGVVAMAGLWAVLGAPPCVAIILLATYKKRTLSWLRGLVPNSA
jgi:O-antigen/teichoic acid export membrane protein